jgi:membrane fusion protein, heavy metal efflux system
MKFRAHFWLYLAIGALCLAGCGDKKDSAAEASTTPPAPAGKPGQVVIPPDSPRLQELKIEGVTSADVPANEVLAPGKIEVNPNRVAHLTMPVAGRVGAVLVKVGDAVQQGGPVLRIESPDADAAVSAYMQARAQTEQARTALVKAKADLDRARDLFEHKAIANKEVLNAESVAAQSQAALDQNQANVQGALRRLEILGLKPDTFGQQLTVTAPVAGKVLEVNVVPGEFRNDLSANLITIADLSTVWVASDVPESDIRFIHQGGRLEIELTAYPGEVFRGRVTRIADGVDPQTRTLKVRAEMENPQERLRPEMFGRIRHVEGSSKLPVIPLNAVLQSEGASVVYREVSRGVFEPVTVTLGARVGDRVAVKSGLAVGDRIVTDGVMLLKAS